MNKKAFTRTRVLGCAGLLVLVGGCAVQRPAAPPAQAPAPVKCQPVSQSDPLVGNWFGVRKQKGVTGELRVLIGLRADGSMTYQEQLKRGSRPAQALNEAGCWSAKGNVLTLHSLESNGEPVEPEDPIYRNQYSIETRSADRLVLQHENGALVARRMPSDYRLPVN